MPTKPWWKSKTVLAALAVEALDLAAQNWSQLESVLPPNFFHIVAFGLPIAMLVLRKATTQGIHILPPSQG